MEPGRAAGVCSLGGGIPNPARYARREAAASLEEEQTASTLVRETAAAVLVREAQVWRWRPWESRRRRSGAVSEETCWEGEMDLGAIDPCWLRPTCGTRRWIFRARSARPRCEARFELHNPA
jgi:1,6-anhydro-N-acetylmuramate kinase